MKYIFLLSGGYIDLAKEEVLNLFDVKDCKVVDRLLIIDLENKKTLNELNQKLALTKSIYKFLFECKVDELMQVMKKYDWNSIYKYNFCVRINKLNDINKNLTKNKKSNKIYRRGLSAMLASESRALEFAEGGLKIKNSLLQKFSEKNLAKYIWNSVKNPKVDLENPKTKIELFFYKDDVYCSLLINDITEDFESRKAHLRPFPHPSSLHPKVARALINISGIKENETLLDPFCGTGGFLIEAGLMNIKVIGYDISKNMVEGCKENLKYFKIKKYKIINKNALQINKKFDCAVTDLPYGLNSNVYLQHNKYSLKKKSNKINLKTNKKNAMKNLEQFYLKFLKTLRKKLKKKAVVIFPSYVNYKKLLKAAKFKIQNEFSIYVHRSLTRKIVLLRNQ